MNSKIDPISPGEIRTSVELVDTTMGALGQRLPIGIPGVSSFELARPSFGIEKRQGALRTSTEAKNPGRLTTRWLAEVVTSVGGERFDRPAACVAKLNQLTHGDVLYLVLRWHLEKNPDGMPLGKAQCGICGANMEDVRIDTAEIPCRALPPNAPEPFVDVGLHRDMPVGDKRVTAIRLRPPRWASVLDMGEAAWRNSSLMVSRLIAGAIVCTDVTDGPIPEACLDELWPVDAALLNEALGMITPTPDLRIEIECPSCKGTNETTIDWRDPAFLTLS